MNSREKITRLLTQRPGEFISGEELASECGISRSAAWKAICALRKEGYSIEARQNCGYRLSGDVLDADSILRHVGAELESRIRIVTYRETDSTNIRARELAASGEPEGTVVCAGTQTAGRGRMGRSFFSPGDTGLYMSVLLRPTVDAATVATNVTPIAAVAVCRAIEQVSGIDAGIKWVNDVFVRGGKVCGILTEAALSVESGTLDHAVVGIGVNVYEPDGGFPPEIAHSAAALLSERRFDMRNELCAAILKEFFELYDRQAEHLHIDEYRRRSIILGKRVAVIPIVGGTEREAVVEDITNSCALRLRFDDGSVSELTSGEIRVRPQE